MKTFVVIHQHRHGTSVHFIAADDPPSFEAATMVCAAIDAAFDPDQDEELLVFEVPQDNILTLEEVESLFCKRTT